MLLELVSDHQILARKVSKDAALKGVLLTKIAALDSNNSVLTATFTTSRQSSFTNIDYLSHVANTLHDLLYG